MKKGENLNERRSYYASDDLIEQLKAKMQPGDTVVNVAYTDYGGTFFDKVLIQYFEEKHPDSIIVESSAFFGQNAFIFGAIAGELIEETDRYLLGFEDLEDYYSNKQSEQEREDFTRFLNDLDKDKYTVSQDGPDRLYELKSGQLGITTQGIDFSERDLIAFCLSEGIISEIVESENLEITLPAIWASYLVNGDGSGLEQEDIDQCDRDTAGLGSCVGVGEDERFEPYKGIGHTVVTFTFRPNNE